MKKPWRTTSAARPTSGISSNGSTRLNKPSPQSVRGRISNPIAVVSPLDDEFPMRHPGTGIAAVPSEEPAKEQTTKESEPEQPKPIETDKIEVPEAPDAQPTPEPEHVTVVEPKDSPTQTQPPPAPQPAPEPRAATSATIRHSVVSSDTARTKSSKGKPEKKKSGLRGALGKLFGRKKKTDSVIAGTNGTTPQQDGSNQHRSVSTVPLSMLSTMINDRRRILQLFGERRANLMPSARYLCPSQSTTVRYDLTQSVPTMSSPSIVLATHWQRTDCCPESAPVPQAHI